MSKLGERIRKTMRTEAAPIGFRAVRRAKNPSLAAGGAAGRRRCRAGRRGRRAGGGCASLPAGQEGRGRSGGRVEGGGRIALAASGRRKSTVRRSQRAGGEGCDFLVFEAESTPATALLEEKRGVCAGSGGRARRHVSADPGVRRLDAVFLHDWKGPLTLQRQLELSRIAGLTRKPLMLPVSPAAESAELECLRDAGVALLVLDGSEKGAMAALPSLRERVEALPAARRRREHADVILPSAAGRWRARRKRKRKGRKRSRRRRRASRSSAKEPLRPERRGSRLVLAARPQAAGA